MQRFKNISAFFFMVLTFFAAPTALAMDGAKILEKIDQVEHHDQATSVVTQIITTSDGDKRTLKIKSLSVNTGEKQLSEYTSPSRVKGVKILMLDSGDDIWSYSPRTRRTRHLASHAKKQKVMGSDFTYEDIGGGKMSEKYNGKVIRNEEYDGTDCYVMELTPTPKGPSYDKVIAWVGKKDFCTRKLDFYEDGGSKPFKTLFLKDIQNISGHITPMEMLMKNHEDGGETYNKNESIDYDTSIPTSTFNSRHLDRK
ncbi:MAG: outer membrane lipoprotein-sorting protein [Desulfobacteraceae bacterium]